MQNKFMTSSRRKNGFTIIESILAILVISTMVVAMGYIMIVGMDSYRLVSDRREALQGARLAVNMMSNDLMNIADPATDIASISATAITFTPAGGGGSVTYQVSGSNLMRGASILAGDVDTGTGFAYYTAGGGTTADQAQVYRIQITVVVDTPSSEYGKVTIRSDVYLRNRYYDSYTQL